MRLFGSKRSTRYLPLFDNAKDEHGRPVDRRDEVEDGAVTFRRDGMVLLDGQGFGFTRAIRQYKFGGGYVANRSNWDHVLYIQSLTGEVFRFRYISRDSNWYRLVDAETASCRPSFLAHALSEDVSDHGVLIGVPLALFRAGWAFALWVLVWSVLWSAVALVFYATPRGVQFMYPHVENLRANEMTELLWLVEGGVLGYLVCAELAGRYANRFCRLILPGAFYTLLTVGGYLHFAGQGLGDTLLTFLELPVIQRLLELANLAVA